MKGVIILILAILISGCAEVSNMPEAKEPVGECSSDLDCGVGGCSGQLCGEKDSVKGIITTCEFREVYGCYKLTNCGCVDGKCQWEVNSEYLECVDNLK